LEATHGNGRDCHHAGTNILPRPIGNRSGGMGYEGGLLPR
jgi:hypothetical protein